jgi:hypothetical protein
MTWKYQQSTGKWFNPAGQWIGTAYSGHGAGLNNSAMEADAGIGPIPAGAWKIAPAKSPPDHLGPLAMPLAPDGFDPHGRSGFFIHGDFAGDADESASHGCIVTVRAVRQLIDASADCDLLVIP